MACSGDRIRSRCTCSREAQWRQCSQFIEGLSNTGMTHPSHPYCAMCNTGSITTSGGEGAPQAPLGQSSPTDLSLAAISQNPLISNLVHSALSHFPSPPPALLQTTKSPLHFYRIHTTPFKHPQYRRETMPQAIAEL